MTDLPTPNLPLLRKALDFVRTEAAKPRGESQWHQATWHVTEAQAEKRGWTCGTAYCVAGYVAQLDGPIEEEGTAAHDGRFIPEYAQDALGLTEAEADRLFAGGNDVADIERVAARIATRGGERL